MITIQGNVGNAAYALPMIQAYPTDVSVQQLLVWDPTNQALAYVPYTGNTLGDFGVGRDLSVIRDAAITRNLTVSGTAGIVGIATFTAIPVFTGGVGSPTGAAPTWSGINTALSHKAVSGANNAELQATKLQIAATDVVGIRKTGWTAMTGTPSRATKVVSTVTLPELAAIVMALEQDLISHGLLGT